MPAGLGYDADAQSFCLEQSSDDGYAEGGVVDVGVAAEQDDVEVVPATEFHLAAGGGEGGEFIVHNWEFMNLFYEELEEGGHEGAAGVVLLDLLDGEAEGDGAVVGTLVGDGGAVAAVGVEEDGECGAGGLEDAGVGGAEVVLVGLHE